MIKQQIENYDKGIHFIGGFLVGLISLVCPVWLALLAVLGLAVGKEIFDYFHPEHTPCALDAICTVVGGMFAVMGVASWI